MEDSNCPHCAKAIDKRAVICPYCREHIISHDPEVQKTFSGIIALIVLGLLVWCCVSWYKADKQVEKSIRDLENLRDKLK